MSKKPAQFTNNIGSRKNTTATSTVKAETPTVIMGCAKERGTNLKANI